MEQVRGSSRWRLTIRRNCEEITVLRGVTCDKQAALPEEIFGLPVVALDDHALAPSAKPAEGEQVEITCGREGKEWDNGRLEALILPPALKRVGDYALMSCRSLHTLELWDDVTDWGGGALMNCSRLSRFVLHRTGQRWGASLAYFADELAGELDISVRDGEEERVRLLLPDYVESYEENGPAHHFDYKIYGAGHPYHHIFPKKQLDLAAYDGLWSQFLREAHEESAALRMARYRLSRPEGLSEGGKAQYLAYLREHTRELLLAQIEENDLAGAAWTVRELSPEQSVCREAAEHARKTGRTAIVAVLLDSMHAARPAGLDVQFDL